jgi:hypothetical protein
MKITRRQLRQLIKEVLLREAGAGNKPSEDLYSYSFSVWNDLETTVPGTQIMPKVSEAIREIYVSISGIAMQFAMPSTPDGKTSPEDVDRNIREITARLEELRKFSRETPEQILVLTGDSALDTADSITYATGTGNIEVEGGDTVASLDEGSNK